MSGSTEEYRDDLGVLHALKPVSANALCGYGDRGAAHYMCGCQPAIHRFKCAYCKDVVGWCLGASDDLPNGCDACWDRVHSEGSGEQ